MNSFQLTNAQADVVVTAQEPGVGLLVVGGPGYGKTTTLVESVAEKVANGVSLNQIVVLTHVRSAAQQLRSRIISRLGTSVINPHITTPYGFCLALQSRFSSSTESPSLLTVAEQLAVVQDLLSGFPLSQWPETVQGGVHTVGFAAEIREISAKARQLSLDPWQVSELGAIQGREEWVTVGHFLEEYLEVLDFQNALDYSELVHRTRLLISESGVGDPIRNEIKAVFCDEFAEFDIAQVKLLADLHRLGVPVIAFADPSTRVFGFRGAEQTGVRNFEEWFVGAKKLYLESNLRSVEGLVAAQNRLLSRLGQPVDLSGEIDDSISAVKCPDQRSQTRQIAANLRRENLAGRDWSEMAVINRSASGQVAVLARALEREGIPVRVIGDALPLSEQPAVRVLLSALRLILDVADGTVDPLTDEPRILELLQSPLCGIDAVGLRQIGRLLRRAQATGAEFRSADSLLVEALLNPEVVQSQLNSSKLPPNAALEGLRRVLGFGALLQKCARLVSSDAEMATLVWQLWDGTDWPTNLREMALSEQTGSVRANRDLDAVIEFFDFLPRAGDQTGGKGLRTLLSFMENQQIANDNQRESQPSGSGVSVLTAHRTKGESWPYVVLVSVDEGNWPRVRTQSSILAAAELAEDSLEFQSYQEQVAAERRLFLLALSRAEKRVLITSLDALSDESLGVSRFVGELGLESVDSDFSELPVPAGEFIGALRRITTSVGETPALRRAAAEQLAELVKLKDYDGRPLFPAADPMNWWIREPALCASPGKIRLSVSSIEAIINCPRQYFLNSLASEDSVSVSQAIGTIFHALAEHRQLDELEASEVPEILDDIFENLPVEPAWKRPVERAEADLMMGRFEDWLLRRTDQFVGSESSFVLNPNIPGVEVEIRGIVDRLELTTEGKLRVIDFKTGKSMLSSREAESNVQLGIYQLAVLSGCFESIAPGVREPADPVLVYMKTGKKAAERTQHSLSNFDPESFYRSPDGERVAHLLKVFDRDGSLNQEALENQWIELLIKRAVRIVLDQNFQAIQNKNCRSCAFQLGCPAFIKGEDND